MKTFNTMAMMAAAATVFGLSMMANAASTDYWVPGGNDLWSSSTNWAGGSGGASGSTLASGNRAVFDYLSGTSPETTTYNISTSGFSLLGVWEYAATATPETFPDVVVNDPNNYTLALTGGNPPLENESNGVLTINAPISLSSAFGIRIGSQTDSSNVEVGTTPGVIVLSGPVSLGGNLSILGDSSSSPSHYGNIVFNGTMSGAYSLTVNNGATGNHGYVELGSANTFTGGVIIDHATLVVSNGSNGSATGSGALTFNANDSALAGSGTISGPVNLKGGISITAGGELNPTVAPSDGYRNFIPTTGTLTLLDGLTMESSNFSTNNVITFNFDVNGSTNSEMSITGGTFAPSYSDTVNVSGGIFTKGYYDLISYSGSTVNYGSYASLQALINTWNLTGAPAGWSLFNDTAHNAIGIEGTPIPEPSTIALLALGGWGLLTIRRKRHTKL